MTPKMMKNIGYAVTGLFSLMMLFGGFMQLMTNEQVVATFHRLQIDNLMMMRFLGVMKLFGIVGMWMPRGRAWAVHGFTFLFCGALACHIGAADPVTEMLPAAFCLCLLGACEWFRGQGSMSTPTALRNAA